MSEEKQTRQTKAEKEVKLLEARVDKLEACISRMAHQSGTGNILKEYGIEKWEPGKNDMKKYKD